MFCDEALDTVEAIAAGELSADGRVAAHLASCPNCALALEGARQVERSLRQRQVPSPPAQFTTRTLARVRRARRLISPYTVALFLTCARPRIGRAAHKRRAEKMRRAIKKR